MFIIFEVVLHNRDGQLTSFPYHDIFLGNN